MSAGDCAAAVIDAPGAPAQVRRVPVPDLADGELLVAVEAATLCGTDVALWNGRMGSPDRFPVIPGHETVGRVIAVRGTRRDSDDRELRSGDRVIWTYPHCDACFYCVEAGQPSLCQRSLRYGRERCDRTPYLLGACAEHQWVPATADIISVPGDLDAGLAASASCALRTVMHGMEKLGPVGGGDVAVVQGAGAVGLYAAAALRQAGAGTLLVAGAPASRLDIARRLGADDCIDVETSDAAARVAWVRAHSGGRGADVVVQCATAAAMPEALEMVRPGGRVVSIGAAVPGQTLQLSGQAFSRSVTVSGCGGGDARHYRAAVDFLARATVREGSPLLDLVGRSYRLDQTGAALQSLAGLAEIKPVVTPGAAA